MSVDILGTSWDQCWSMVQYSFTSTETRRLVRTDSPGRPPQLSHRSWTMIWSVSVQLPYILGDRRCVELGNFTTTTTTTTTCHMFCSAGSFGTSSGSFNLLTHFCCCWRCWSLLHSAILRTRADSLHSHVIPHEWIAFYSAFLTIHWSGSFSWSYVEKALLIGAFAT